jgi:hypothetical protein
MRLCSQLLLWSARVRKSGSGSRNNCFPAAEHSLEQVAENCFSPVHKRTSKTNKTRPLRTCYAQQHKRTIKSGSEILLGYSHHESTTDAWVYLREKGLNLNIVQFGWIWCCFFNSNGVHSSFDSSCSVRVSIIQGSFIAMGNTTRVPFRFY